MEFTANDSSAFVIVEQSDDTSAAAFLALSNLRRQVQTVHLTADETRRVIAALTATLPAEEPPAPAAEAEPDQVKDRDGDVWTRDTVGCYYFEDIRRESLEELRTIWGPLETVTPAPTAPTVEPTPPAAPALPPVGELPLDYVLAVVARLQALTR